MKTLLQSFVLAFLFVLVVATASADTVYLNNGDRITGKVQKLDGERLIVQTEYAGEIHLSWSIVSAINAEKPLVLSRKNNPRLEATNIARTDEEKFVVTTGEVNEAVPFTEVKNVRSAQQQRLYDLSLHPVWRDYWTATGTLGFALASGNSDTRNLNFGLDSSRKTLHDKTTVNATSVYATDSRLSATTANAARGGIRYDYDLKQQLFVFGNGQFEFDNLQSLDLRSTLGGGFGWHAFNTPKHSFDLLGGLAYTREAYDTPQTKNFTTGTVGFDYLRHVNSSTSLTHRFEFNTYLNDPGNFNAHFSGGVSTRINKLFSWQTKLTNQYVSDPLPGNRKNDLYLTTGLGLTFSTVPE